MYLSYKRECFVAFHLVFSTLIILIPQVRGCESYTHDKVYPSYFYTPGLDRSMDPLDPCKMDLAQDFIHYLSS